MTVTEQLLDRSREELATTANELNRMAVEILAASKDLDGDAEALRLRALGLQAEALRCILSALAARSVAERLSMLAQLQEDA